MLPKALAAAPDIICVDLEDAIAPQHKAVARRDTLAAFGALPENPADCELVVREPHARGSGEATDEAHSGRCVGELELHLPILGVEPTQPCKLESHQ